jgi:glycosyltransferase involved in cell wall biosynthesis
MMKIRVNDKPRVSILLMTYHHERFIGEAIFGVLSQDYDNLEIIISDDCSSDATWEIIKKKVGEYQGNHDVVIHRNEKNLGFVSHFNQILSMATGELLVYAPGDDISKSNRVEKLVRAYVATKEDKVLLYSSAICIDDAGQELGVAQTDFSWRNKKKMAVSSDLYIGATGAFSRSLIESFPPIEVEGCYEDLVWGHRAYLCGELIHVPERLIYYRKGGLSEILEGDLSTKKAQLKLNRVQKSVLRQRILDVRYFYKSDDLDILKYLEYRLRMEEAKTNILKGELKLIFWKGLLSPLAVFHAYHRLYKSKYFKSRKQNS